MDFLNEDLINIHGNWVRVQVAFYDFLMKCALGKPDVNAEDVMMFMNENDGYESLIERALDTFETPEVAWLCFLNTKE